MHGGPAPGGGAGLRVTLGQCSDRGRKAANQDFHGAVVPTGTELRLKGVALALADGISSSPVGHVAAETAVKSFLTDYYCTSDAWSVRLSGESVLAATNAWLHHETRRSHAAQDLDRGHVCTFSALVLKGARAHLFHVGDARIHRLQGSALEQLTEDHRVVISAAESYLGRGLGLAPGVQIDYACHELAPGDVFLLTTDGVHSVLPPVELGALLRMPGEEPESLARRIVMRALERGSEDNVTAQVIRIDALPEDDAEALVPEAAGLPLSAGLEPPVDFDGYHVVREIHASDRSRVYLARDQGSGDRVVLKLPASSVREDPALLRQFLREEWIARRVSSPHLVRAHATGRPRTWLYAALEYVDGPSLRQWMHDHPRPPLEAVRGILEQLVLGLRALHRRQMVHADLRPENVLIDAEGTVKLVDFGSVHVAGLAEARLDDDAGRLLGTLQYTAPECLAGEAPTWQSDLFSAAVIAYEMLTGRLPYAADAARVRTPAQQRALRYRSARTPATGVPEWVDGCLRRALDPLPQRRHEALSEFLQELRVPNPRYRLQGRPLIERDPVRFWKLLALLLAMAVFVLLALLRRA